MIDRDDLRAAVGAGIVSEAQAASLASLAHNRSNDRQGLTPGDEPFELFRGFNEIFIVLGLIILASGWAGVVGFGMTDGVQDYRMQMTISGLVAAAILWLLSEYFIRRRRMIGPAIVLSLYFAVNAGASLISYFAQPFMVAQEDFSSLPLPMALTILAMALFWWRFKVPVAIAMMAVGTFALSMVLAANASGTPESLDQLFLLSAGGPFALITLALGILFFIIAMYFDMSDPHRVTRRSAQGFWMHVVAAPALINTIALTLITADTVAANVTLVAVLTLFAIVAIIIDRRSFLMAAIGYSVALASTIFEGENAYNMILILGIGLLLLGSFWERIRARLLALLPSFVPLHRLPPSQF